MHVDVNSCNISNLVGKGSREMLTIFFKFITIYWAQRDIFNGMIC